MQTGLAITQIIVAVLLFAATTIYALAARRQSKLFASQLHLQIFRTMLDDALASGNINREEWKQRWNNFVVQYEKRFRKMLVTTSDTGPAGPRKEKNDMSDYLLEQYKIIAHSYDQEVNRFWIRFNIFVGFQLGGLIGIFASSKLLIPNPFLFRIALITMIIISSAAALVVLRGFLMHQMILRVFVELEKKSKGELELLRLASQVSRIPIGLNQIVASTISVLLDLVWIVFLVYAECIKYHFVLPK